MALTLVTPPNFPIKDRDKPHSLTIYNGTVTATGGSAGIGGGDGGRVTIYGGTVTARGGGNGAGIGGGGTGGGPQGSPGGNGGEVIIYDGTVTATGSGNGAGIGGGGVTLLYAPSVIGGAGGTVTIYGGTVTATGGSDAAGIGGGRFVNSQSNFSTGENGQAVIFATGGGSGSAIGDQTKRDSWSGVIFQGDGGQVYGSSITPTEDFAIGEGQILTIGENQTLTIPAGVTLTNEGTITNNGTIINHGTIINKNEGTLTGEGEVDGNPVTYEVTGVSLSSETLALVAGDSETLTATITPDKAANQSVTWTSDPSGIVEITPDTTDSKTATITATGTGETTITATVGGKTATCEVTVERPYVPPANPNYRIDVTTTAGGTVDKDPAAAKAGETVTLTPAPEEGYEV
ncbi:Ig-like domain-containing protein, partial [Evtepia sp.]